MEAAVRWSPFSTETRQRFLLVDVTDQSLTLSQISRNKNSHASTVQVARYGRLPNFGAFDWSKTDESVVALGLVSGSACLVKLNEDGRPSETVATFKLRQQRKCNSIALSQQDWLAVALDRTRSDACLNIFDASGHQESSSEPIRRLCPTEVVSSVRFSPSHPQTLLVAAQRSFIRLYDLRDGYFGTNNSAQVATRNVNNIAIDPLDDNYFASAGSLGDPSVTVWDKRWIQSGSHAGSEAAVFDFQPAVDNAAPTTIWSLRYSGQQCGRLAMCSSRGELKVIDMTEGHSSLLHASEYLPANTHGGQSWTHNRYVSQTRRIQKPFDEDPAADSNSKLIAFDWISADSRAVYQDVLALRPNRHVEILRVPRTITQATVTARHDISVSFEDLSIVEPAAPSSQAAAPQTADRVDQSAEDFGPLAYQGEVVHRGVDDQKIVCQINSTQLPGMLADPTLQRERCRRGYLLDCVKNMNIVAGDRQLERLWEIVHHFRQQAAGDSMIAERQHLDLSYVGIAAVCGGDIGKNPNRKLSFANGKVEDAIVDLAASRGLPPFDGERTRYPEARQLCLEMCGWKFSKEKLEEECRELTDRGLHYQAVVQAVLHECRNIALNLLRTLIRSKAVPNIGLGALLAADSMNHEQREMCLWMAADTDDPALKALLAFLTTGDWRDVMKTNYLHLGYRVALGLKYLNDTDLAGFIQGETARVVKNGDLEGILLTGLGERSMDLFQTYITKTNDLQTAVLASALSNPRYVDDVRFDMWKETYFTQMQSWRTFTERSQFIVQHGQLATTKDGHNLLDPPLGQVSLRCNHCQLSLAKYNKGVHIDHRSATVPAVTKGSVAVSASTGIVCPKCQRHMPRCGICRMWMGTPDPNQRGGAKELSKLDNVMAKFLTFCVSCEHGFHAHHAKSWFRKHATCPVPDCRCLCTIR